jgi:hypothetical protein
MDGAHFVEVVDCGSFTAVTRDIVSASGMPIAIREVAEIKKCSTGLSKSDRAPNANEKPENCYCSSLPKGSGLCLPCYTRLLARLP